MAYSISKGSNDTLIIVLGHKNDLISISSFVDPSATVIYIDERDLSYLYLNNIISSILKLHKLTPAYTVVMGMDRNTDVLLDAITYHRVNWNLIVLHKAKTHRLLSYFTNQKNLDVFVSLDISEDISNIMEILQSLDKKVDRIGLYTDILKGNVLEPLQSSVKDFYLDSKNPNLN